MSFSSFKGLALSTIPNAYMEANKYTSLVCPSYESITKVTWQIFSIPNVKTTMDFPEGTVFENSVKSDWQAKKDEMLPLHISLEKPQ